MRSRYITSQPMIKIQELNFQTDEASKHEQYKHEELDNLKRELNEEYLNEENFCMEKSRLTWLRYGDKNTKFFHANRKNRIVQRRIKSLFDEDGKEWLADRDLGCVAESYFKKLFSSENVGVEFEMWNELSTSLSPE